MNKISYGPDHERLRLIWSEGPTPTALESMKNSITQDLMGVGILRPEEEGWFRRPLKFHLTLARFASRERGNLPLLTSAGFVWRGFLEEIAVMETEWTATHRTLFKIKMKAVI